MAELTLAQNLLNTLTPPRKRFYRGVQSSVPVDGDAVIDGN